MTLILGIEEKEKVLIGADSAATAPDNNEIYSLDTAKVFKAGPYAIGCTMSSRLRQVLQYDVELPEPPEDDLDRFMSTTFVRIIREALKADGFQQDGWNILVGVRGQLYGVTTAFEVVRETTPYTAAGSGRHVAYGALYALEGSGKSVRERAEIALRAAQHFDKSVRGPFHFVDA